MLQGEHSAILSTFIKLPFVIKIFVVSIFEWPLKTDLLYMQICVPKYELKYFSNYDKKLEIQKLIRSQFFCPLLMTTFSMRTAAILMFHCGMLPMPTNGKSLQLFSQII